jgi:hypothetical protein
MKAKRLLRLADWLDRIAKTPPKTREFNLFYWKQNRACGTVCCAVGEASLIPEFKKAGLKVAPYPEFKGTNGWDAVKRFFDINYLDVIHLFAATSYGPDEVSEPAVVADRIRKFVASRKEALKIFRKAKSAT